MNECFYSFFKNEYYNEEKALRHIIPCVFTFEYWIAGAGMKP